MGSINVSKLLKAVASKLLQRVQTTHKYVI